MDFGVLGAYVEQSGDVSLAVNWTFISIVLKADGHLRKAIGLLLEHIQLDNGPCSDEAFKRLPGSL